MQRRYGTRFLHRQIWMMTHGPIPQGMVVMHLCDNPACFRLDHLRLGTQADNIRDMTNKGRGYNQKKTHCPRGHEYDEENTRVGPDGRRWCRACARSRPQRPRRRSIRIAATEVEAVFGVTLEGDAA